MWTRRAELSKKCWRKSLKADRKSTRLNSSHSQISYAVFCLKKKNKPHTTRFFLASVQANCCPLTRRCRVNSHVRNKGRPLLPQGVTAPNVCTHGVCELVSTS